MMVATVHKESRAKAARHLRVFKMQSPPLGNLTKSNGFFFFEMQSLGFGSEAFSTAKGILYRKALRTVSNRSRRACADCFRSRLRRLGFASPLEGATPQRTRPDYHALTEGSIKTGTFYFAGKRNFLFCLDTWFPEAYFSSGCSWPSDVSLRPVVGFLTRSAPLLSESRKRRSQDRVSIRQSRRRQHREHYTVCPSVRLPRTNRLNADSCASGAGRGAMSPKNFRPPSLAG